MIGFNRFIVRRQQAREARIVAWLAANPGSPASAVARGAGVRSRGVYRDLRRLTEQGRVVREWRAVEGGGRAHYTLSGGAE